MPQSAMAENDLRFTEGVAQLPMTGKGDDFLNLENRAMHRPCNDRPKMAPTKCNFPVESIFIPSFEQSHITPDRKLSPAELASLPKERGPTRNGRSNRNSFSRRLSNTTMSARALSEGQDLSPITYNSEADFLVQNQAQFASEDFSAVLAALVEETKMEEIRREQERDSIKLARSLMLSDAEGARTRQRVSSSDDMAALVVALRAELEETSILKRNEEESFRAACRLIEEERRGCGIHYSCFACDETKVDDSSVCVLKQCQACLFDIESKESIRELECGHMFHTFCINRFWLNMKKDNCPFCRQSAKQISSR